MKRTWTNNEIELLLEHYNSLTNDELQKMFPNKTPLAIYKKAYALGLRKTQEIEFKNRSNARKGEKGSNWHGGKTKTSGGYKQIYMPGHHRADSRGYVLEHIFVFERETGIKIPNNCCIHHLNGEKCDNEITNLCMLTHSAHTILHHKGAKRTEETRQNISKGRKKHE